MLGTQRITALAGKSQLVLLSSLIGGLGVAMLDLAAFVAMRPSLGDVGAATAVGVVDLVIAGALVAWARLSPSAHLDAVVQVRDMAMEDMEMQIESLLGARADLERLVRHPLEAVTPGVVAALTKSILGNLRRNEQEAT
jgi:hypothetical protein